MKVVPLSDVEEVRFTVVTGASPGSRVTFAPQPRGVRIGRAVDNDIVINDASVSRLHARVDLKPDQVTIQDLGSSGGVEKMGFRLGTNPEPLYSGDEIKIGGTILRFELLLTKMAVKRAAKPDAKAEDAGKKKISLPPPSAIVGSLQQILLKIGLRTAFTQVIALSAVAALLVVAFWPSAPGPPPQASGTNAINLDAVVGYIPGGDQSHLDGAAFEIPDGDGIAIFFKVNAPSGIDVRVGDKLIASPKPSNDWRDFGLLVMPRAVANQGRPVFVLDNLGYAPANGPVDPATARGWAVARMWMTRVASGSTLPAQLAADAKVLENVAVLAAQDPKDLYKLVAGLRVLTMSVMKVAGRPAVLIQAGDVSRGDQVTGPLRSARAALEEGTVARALDPLVQALSAAESRLNKEFRERSNALTLLQRRGASKEAGELLFTLEPWLPDATDPRHRELKTARQNLDVVGQYAYDEAKKKAAREAE